MKFSKQQQRTIADIIAARFQDIGADHVSVDGDHEDGDGNNDSVVVCIDGTVCIEVGFTYESRTLGLGLTSSGYRVFRVDSTWGTGRPCPDYDETTLLETLNLRDAVSQAAKEWAWQHLIQDGDWELMFPVKEEERC